MTQKQLILEYIKEHGSILPAKVGGLIYKGEMLGSESSKRCREMRAVGLLRSEQDGKFERFYLGASYNGSTADSKPVSRGSVPLAPAKLTKDNQRWCKACGYFMNHTKNCPQVSEIKNEPVTQNQALF